RRDRAGGKAAEQRPVLPPGRGRLLVERVADESKELSRLADHLADEVRQRNGHKQDRNADRDPNRAARPREPSPRPPRVPPPAAKAGEEAVAVCWHVAGPMTVARTCQVSRHHESDSTCQRAERGTSSHSRGTNARGRMGRLD